MAANKYVMNQQTELDCAAVERSLATLRQARSEISGWHAITLDPDAREALQETLDHLDDMYSDLTGSTADMNTEEVL